MSSQTRASGEPAGLEFHALPWLWDLDGEAIHKKQAQGLWDWEQLASQLQQPGIFSPDDRSIQLPSGLRNRRRIWRLLELARVGDVAEKVERRRKARRADESATTVSLLQFSASGPLLSGGPPPGFHVSLPTCGPLYFSHSPRNEEPSRILLMPKLENSPLAPFLPVPAVFEE
jgi:hypothetical protein